MKKIFLSFLVLFIIGCTSNDIENYQSNQNLTDVYVTGQKNNVACYWLNNQITLLDNGGITNTIAKKIIVAGSDVHVFGESYGFSNTTYLYWKNGILTNLNTLLNPLNESVFTISDFTIDGNDVYFCGNSGDYSAASKNVCYWKNNVKTILNSSDAGVASKIVISNSDVYVLANVFLLPNYTSYSENGFYKNGVFYTETSYCGLYGMNKFGNDIYLFGNKDATLSGVSYDGYYNNINNNSPTYTSNVGTILLLEKNNSDLIYSDGINFYTNNVLSTFFHNGTFIDDFKITNNNKYILSHVDNSEVIFYLDINTTNSMQINLNQGQFTSLFIVEN